ncbi:MAG: hypothetical protein B6U94_01820 [Thermofilum sp. ex4484_79]|nr:MAG: hypothetical protein B6U94_01820 [Thermofilum sp. ex4484_79]
MIAYFIGHIVMDTVEWKGKIKENIGGTVVYGALVASKLGVKPYIVSKVGKDFPTEYLDFLKNNGVLIDNIKFIEGKPTTRFKLIYDRQGNRKLKLISKCEDINLEDIPCDKNSIYILGPVIGEVPIKAFDLLRDTSSYIASDIQGFIRKNSEKGIYLEPSDSALRVIRYSSVVHLEYEEAKVITREQKIERILQKILEIEHKVILLTMGEKGAYIINENEVYFVPAIKPEKVVDLTGTGDVFTTTFAIEYFKQGKVIEAAALSAAAASYLVEEPGISGIREKEHLFKRAIGILDKIKKIYI